jgi:DNA-binding MarR family transcriptional regulator
VRATTPPVVERQAAGDALVENLDADFPAVVSRLYRRLRAEKAGDQISDSLLSVLALLVREGPRTLRELSDREHVTPPSMNQTVNALADARYVARTDDPEDGRKVILVATAKGAALVAETRHRRHAWLTARLQGLSAGERQILSAATGIIGKIADS